MRRVSILGATGSVGQSTLDLIRRDRAAYDVVALTGGHNVAQLARDAREVNADIAVIADEGALADLRHALEGSGVEAASGPRAVHEAAHRPADWIMSAIVGMAGLAPGWSALEQGATLALANKESLVAAGSAFMQHAHDNGATILPVDSEHSAIFQALTGEDIHAVERIVITASGGPFRDLPAQKLDDVTLQQASTHPNWDMGQRITIDSASLFNKALELIETREFFGVEPSQIEAVIHPESLIHAIVGFRDGAMMAHLGAPDMRHAIGYALNYPRRKPLPVDRLDLARIGSLTFTAPDPQRFPALRLAREVMETRGLAGAAFIAAKDAALDAFIAGQLRFPAMAEVVEETLDEMSSDTGLGNAALSLDMVQDTDRAATRIARQIIKKRAG